MTDALIHTGVVTHVRHAAPQHRLSSRVWMVSLDLDRLDAIAASSLLFRHNRPGVVSLRDADHGPRDGSSLRTWVAARLDAAGLGAFAAQIRFLVIPRVLGCGFNPIATFFCNDRQGRLGAILHQVKNTFGGQHGYLLPVDPPVDPGAPAPLRHSAAKRLHVSPFFDTQGGYRFTCSPPDFTDPRTTCAFTIRYGADDTPRLTATMRLEARPMTDRALLGQIARMPLMPVKVVAGIHWHALRVWLRGARYHPVPPPPAEPVSLGARR